MIATGSPTSEGQAGCDQAFFDISDIEFSLSKHFQTLELPTFFPSFFPELPRTSQFFSQVPWQKPTHIPRFFGHGQDLNRPSLERRHLRHVGLGQRPGSPVAVPSGGGAAGSHGGVCLQPADAVNQRAWLVVWNIFYFPQLGWWWSWSNLTFTPWFFRGVVLPPTRCSLSHLGCSWKGSYHDHGDAF